jgi:hypothetical protein
METTFELPEDSIARFFRERRAKKDLEARTFTPDEMYVLWAFTLSATQNIHSAQDMLSSEQWEIGENLFKRLNSYVDESEEGDGHGMPSITITGTKQKYHRRQRK